MADRVFGQAGSFTTNACNRHLIAANSLCGPVRVALDASDHLFVSDFGNNRVLEYDAPLTAGDTADLVFGQLGSFTTGSCNRGALGAGTLCAPTGVRIDATGNVYVADTANNRVLEYITPLITRTTAAHLVIGPGDSECRELQPGRSRRPALPPCANRGCGDRSGGNLYVADAANSRVLEYIAPLTTAPVAALVFGQSGSFTSSECDLASDQRGHPMQPLAVWRWTAAGDLFVSDTGNSRVLVFQPPFAAKPVPPAKPDNRTLPTRGQPHRRPRLSPRIVRRAGQPRNAAIVCTWPTSTTTGCWRGRTPALPWRICRADLVIGQPDAFSSACGVGTKLCNPNGVAVDQAGNLYVADTTNNRILEYNSPFTTDINPDIIMQRRLQCRSTRCAVQPELRWTRPTTCLSPTNCTAPSWCSKARCVTTSRPTW